jgi:hypothetical protein
MKVEGEKKRKRRKKLRIDRKGTFSSCVLEKGWKMIKVTEKKR